MSLIRKHIFSILTFLGIWGIVLYDQNYYWPPSLSFMDSDVTLLVICLSLGWISIILVILEAKSLLKFNFKHIIETTIVFAHWLGKILSPSKRRILLTIALNVLLIFVGMMFLAGDIKSINSFWLFVYSIFVPEFSIYQVFSIYDPSSAQNWLAPALLIIKLFVCYLIAGGINLRMKK